MPVEYDMYDRHSRRTIKTRRLEERGMNLRMEDDLVMKCHIILQQTAEEFVLFFVRKLFPTLL